MIGVRPARSDDARDIARIEVETWQTTYAGMLTDHALVGMSVTRQGHLWARVLRPGHGVWVWEEEPHGLLGFGHCGRHRSPSLGFDGEIYMLYVLPDAQGRGIGRQLLLAMFDSLRDSGCRAALVWVVRANPSRFFYERMGGKLVQQQQMPFGGKDVDVLGYGWNDLGSTGHPCKDKAARKPPGER